MAREFLCYLKSGNYILLFTYSVVYYMLGPTLIVQVEQARAVQLFRINRYNSFCQVRDSKPAIKPILPTGIQYSTMELYAY
jgi:hypothetical protein